MTKAILLVTEVDPQEHSAFANALPEYEVKCSLANLQSVTDVSLEQVEIVCPMVHSPIGVSEMEKMPSLKLISTRSTGYDHIDLREARNRNITVCSVPEYGSRTVAEFTFGLILNLSRWIHRAYARNMVGEFGFQGLLGQDLFKKTISIIGYGRIGKCVAEIARGFGMNVLVYDPFVQSAEAANVKVVSLEEALGNADVLTLCCPSVPETYHLMNDATFSKLKNGALFVNTARGNVVDSMALLRALDAGHVAAAAIDVFEGNEDLSEDAVLSQVLAQQDFKTVAQNLTLLHHPRLLMTPHMAFYSQEALGRIQSTTIENIRGFLRGKPQHVVNA